MLVIVIGQNLTSLTYLDNAQIKDYLIADYLKKEEVQSFEEVILKYPKAPITLLLDNEHDFDIKNISGIKNKDFDKEVNKKIASALNLNQFIGVIDAGKIKFNYFEKKYIFLSIKSTEITDFWIEFLLQFKNNINNIYSLAVQNQLFLKNVILPHFIPFKLEETNDNLSYYHILVTNSQISGYKISLFQNHYVILSENIKIKPKSSANYIAHEIEQIIHKIISKYHLSLNKLDVIIIVSLAIKQEFNTIKAFANQYVILSPEEISDQLEIRKTNQNISGYIDEVIISLLMKKKLLYPLIHSSLLKIIKFEKFIIFWKKLFYLTPFALLLLTILYSQNYNNNDNLNKLQTTLTSLLNQNEDEKKNLKLLKNNEIVVELIPFSNKISNQTSPFEVIEQLKSFFNDQTSVNSIKWEHSSESSDKLGITTIYFDFILDRNNEQLFLSLEDLSTKIKNNFTNYYIKLERDKDIKNFALLDNIPIKLVLTGPIENEEKIE